MPDANGYRPQEAKVMQLLGDGHPHRPDELKFVLDDPQMLDSTLKTLLSNLRRILRIKGQDISTERATGLVLYRLVRLTASHARQSEPFA